jgi:AcrR family transcriptional regulator
MFKTYSKQGNSMTAPELDPKKRILQAAMELLNEQEPETITVRQIAERAQVGVGLINYHFQTRDNLLNEAVGGSMGEVAAQWLQANEGKQDDPVLRLKNLLKETSNIGVRFPAQLRVSISFELQHGNFSVAQMLIPILREIFGMTKSEKELRVLAFQIITPLQLASIRNDAFRAYAGIDLFNEEQRNAMIDMLIDNILTTKE